MSPTTLLADPALRITRPRPCVTVVVPAKAARRGVELRARWFVLTAIVALASSGLLYLGTWPPLATVMSASMAPTINTGDMVVLQRLKRPVRIGDIVAVRVPDEARSRYGYPPIVIHRAVRIGRDGMLTTKGDGREEVDPFTVPATAPKTRVVATLPAAGQVLGFLSSTLGLLWIAAGALLFGGLPLLDRYRHTRRREQDDHARRLEDAVRDAANAREQLHAVTSALAAHLEALPARIETAVASAVAGVEHETATRVAEPPAATFVADVPTVVAAQDEPVAPAPAEPAAPVLAAPVLAVAPVVVAAAEPVVSAPAAPVAAVPVVLAPAVDAPRVAAPPDRGTRGRAFVAASTWAPPAPDLIGVLARPARGPAFVAASTWAPSTPDVMGVLAPPVRGPSFVAASKWTPDLMGVLAPPVRRFERPAAPSWDALPSVLLRERRGSGGVLSA